MRLRRREVVFDLLLGWSLLDALPWANAEEVTVKGQASVIDGDTIEIHGKRIRLHGIDAPESRQLCDLEGQLYRCGQMAAVALADRIENVVVSCRQVDTDRYRRIVAVCYAGGEDLNGWLVRQGWAVAYLKYSHDYESDEHSAQSARIGIWRGDFLLPWEWRKIH